MRRRHPRERRRPTVIDPETEKKIRDMLGNLSLADIDGLINHDLDLIRKRIRYILAKEDIKLYQLARVLGISAATMYDFMSGGVEPTFRTVCRITRGTGRFITSQPVDWARPLVIT